MFSETKTKVKLLVCKDYYSNYYCTDKNIKNVNCKIDIYMPPSTDTLSSESVNDYSTMHWILTLTELCVDDSLSHTLVINGNYKGGTSFKFSSMIYLSILWG